ncbi:MAG: LPXTG cell wall anchor domain-containing protein [Actinomycetota bacterium]
MKAGSGGVLGGGLEQGDDDGADVSGAADDALPGTGAQGVVAFTALGAALIAAGLMLVRRYRSRPRDPSTTT